MKICDISKSFEGRTVLTGFSLTVSQGEHIAFLGESGKGKTTLLRIIAGLEKPDAGQIIGVNQNGLCYMFQEPRLFPTLTALKNVAAVLPDYPKKAALEKAAACLEQVGLLADADKYPDELSGGMSQRVALARTLCADGDPILLDEPFSALDRETADKMIALVARKTEGKTLLLVTHNPQEAEILCGTKITL